MCSLFFFSVYSFLRSFRLQLFLHPFTIDEFSGAINFGAQNTLIDAIHVALMHALKRHLEMLSSEGVEFASKAMRCLDWSLLDSFTWPAFVFHYFMLMGYAEGPEWSGFCIDLLNKDYYTISVTRKIKILQILCDDVLDSVELRTEIDMRGETEVGLDSDFSANNITENVSRRFLTRFARASACKEGNAVDVIMHDGITDPLLNGNHLRYENNGGATDVSVDGDGNRDECCLCGMDGTLICCDGCPSAYHTRCVGLIKTQIPEGPWYCPECTVMKLAPLSTTGTSHSGAVLFGIDPYEQVFLGTCNHLLVLSATDGSSNRYYNETDIVKVLRFLLGSVEHRSLYMEISRGIERHWHMQDTVRMLISANSNLDNGNGSQNHACHVLNEIPPSNVNLQSPATETILHAPSCLKPNGIETINCMNGGLHDRVNNNHFLYPQEKGCYSTELSSIEKNSAMETLYVETLFKPHLYVNHYVHGAFSASAAAMLAAVLEETRGLEVTKPSSTRKASSDISLQLKAFSAVASRFFWPSNDKKLIEVPRERCGWCHSCKLPSNNRRGCYLNAAASNATKSTWKVLSSLRLSSNGDSSFRSMSTYLLYLEEMLHGLTIGLFKNASRRMRWRREVEDASSYATVKRLILILEENIRPIALVGEWHKAPDDLCMEYATTPSAQLLSVSSQKRFHSGNGKYNKKHSSIDIVVDDPDDKRFTWFRGESSNLVCNAKLSTTVIQKAARQGGSRRVSGIFYLADHEIPKRSRCLIWRYAVEACKNFAQLAFQVRHLDNHVRWIDIVRADQNLQEVKGSDVEASFFRNAIICDKKIEENRVIYGVDFKDQKHFPSRIMKNVIEEEEFCGGKLKYWFSEVSIPLYLIKEYEETFDNLHVGSSRNSEQLSKLQKTQIKNSRKDIFAFLVRRRDKMESCLCACCEKDALLENTTVCNACQGYCHADCTVTSRSGIQTNVAETLVICMTCYTTKGFANSEKISESPTTPLPIVPLTSTSTVLKTPKLNAYKKTADDTYSKIVVKSETHPVISAKRQDVVELRQPASASEHKRKICNWGLIWKKKREDSDFDPGITFRRNNIILQGNPDKSWVKPVCKSCNKEYNRQLMYIHCESCKCWFHAEAVELEESKLNDLIGFKCCRCRRIKPPLCPYSDEPEKPVIQRSRNRSTKHENAFLSSIEPGKSEFSEFEYYYDQDSLGYMPDSLPSEISTMQMNESELFNSGFDDESNVSEVNTYFTVDEVIADDLPSSLSRVDNCAQESLPVEYECSNTGVGARKLPVRRQARHQGDDAILDDNVCQVEDCGPDLIDNQESSSCIQWHTSGSLHDEIQLDCDGLNYDDMEFEPQTYFSFTELLAGEADQSNGFDASGNSNNLSSEEGDNSVMEGSTNVCKQCLIMDPVPDLACEICHITMHSYCSPWVESDTAGCRNWRCGNCREWR